MGLQPESDPDVEPLARTLELAPGVPKALAPILEPWPLPPALKNVPEGSATPPLQIRGTESKESPAVIPIPGTSCIRSDRLRDVGRSLISSPVKTVVCLAFRVSMRLASAVTLTTSRMSPGLRSAFTVVVTSDDVGTLSRSTLLNPCRVNVTLYVPIGSVAI